MQCDLSSGYSILHHLSARELLAVRAGPPHTSQDTQQHCSAHQIPVDLAITLAPETCPHAFSHGPLGAGRTPGKEVAVPVGVL